MNITPPDIIIILILGLFTFNGFRHGFIEEIKKLISLISGFIFAAKLHHILIPFLEPYINSEAIKITLAYMGIFIITIVIITMIGKVLQRFIEFVLLGWLNRILGMLLGLLKGFLIISIMIFILQAIPIKIDQNNTIKEKLENESSMYKICQNVKQLVILTVPIDNNFNSYEKLLKNNLKEKNIQQHFK